MATKETDRLLPPYIPWQTFGNYLAGLKGTTVPHTLDNSVRPKSMAGGVWRQMLSAIRFLGLTNDGNVVCKGLEALARAHGSEQWKAAVKEHVLPAYEDIIGELPIENATATQLNKQFRDAATIDGQMLKKCVRFYIHALRESGTRYSSHFAMRDDAPNAPRKPRTKVSKKRESTNGTPKREGIKPADGTMTIPIPFKGKVAGQIIVPNDITAEDCAMVRIAVQMVEAFAGVKRSVGAD